MYLFLIAVFRVDFDHLKASKKFDKFKLLLLKTTGSGCYDSLKAYNDQSQHDQNGMLQYIEAINQTNESLKRTNEALENTNEKLIADFTEVQQKVEEFAKTFFCLWIRI